MLSFMKKTYLLSLILKMYFFVYILQDALSYINWLCLKVVIQICSLQFALFQFLFLVVSKFVNLITLFYKKNCINTSFYFFKKVLQWIKKFKRKKKNIYTKLINWLYFPNKDYWIFLRFINLSNREICTIKNKYKNRVPQNIPTL